MTNLILSVRRAETPFYASLKSAVQFLLTVRLPLPIVLKALYRMLYGFHFGLRDLARRVYMFFYGEPLFRSRCDAFGLRCMVRELPEITGHTSISVGDDVAIWGHLHIISGRTYDKPTLRVDNRVQIGHGVLIVVNEQVVVEEGAMIGNNCYITDTESHPRDARQRIGSPPPVPSEIRPVRIGQSAWIGVDCTIYRGVTIGEGAIVGTRSVVIADVPAYAIAMGNPARVIGSTRTSCRVGEA
jgi:acetyltransferase-like isoleucine patch superfamily enzyme